MCWQMQALFRIGRGIAPEVPRSLSKDARGFILKCLQVNPSERPTAAQLLDHPFLKRPLQTSHGPASPFYNSRWSWKLLIKLWCRHGGNLQALVFWTDINSVVGLTSCLNIWLWIYLSSQSYVYTYLYVVCYSPVHVRQKICKG